MFQTFHHLKFDCQTKYFSVWHNGLAKLQNIVWPWAVGSCGASLRISAEEVFNSSSIVANYSFYRRRQSSGNQALLRSLYQWFIRILAKSRFVLTAVQSAFASAQAAKNRKVRGVKFSGAARSCGGICCDPGLLRRGLRSDACGKCSTAKEARLTN